MELAVEEWQLKDGLDNSGMGSHTWYSKHTWLYLDYGTSKYSRTQCYIVTCNQCTACTLFHFVCSTCLLN